MPDLRKLRTDLAAFADAVGLPLRPWQADSLALDRRTTAIVAPRQSGKSRSLAALALWWAFSRPEQLVLIVSAGESASRRLLAEAASVAVRSPLLSNSLVDENSGLLTLSNGSEIRSVPASERSVRGWSVDLLLADECSQIEPDLLLSACLPTVAARPNGRVVLASSPGPPEGPFYDFATSDSDTVATAHWSLADADWISADVVEQAREQLPPSAFAREYLGQFTDAGDEALIPRPWIAAAQERTLEPNEDVVFGVDLARGGDESVCVRLDGGQARVVWANRDDDLMRLADLIERTVRAEPGPEPSALLDVTGLGFGVHDRLIELGVNVQPFYAAGRAPDPLRHLTARAAAWFALRERFRLGQIDLDPADKVLASQLAAQKFTIAPSGALQVASKTSQRGSPDRADALVLAAYAAGPLAGLGLDAALRMVAAGRREAYEKGASSTEQWLARHHTSTEMALAPREPRDRIDGLDDEVRRSAAGQLPMERW